MIRKTIMLVFMTFTGCLISCKKDVLKGLDKKALFARPSTAELQAVLSNWRGRELIPTNIVVEESHKINDKLALKIVSYRLSGGKQYAAVLLPAGMRSLPVQLYVSGFGLDIPLSSMEIKLSDNGSIPFIYVLPSLRGQSLKMIVNGVSYTTPVAEGKRDDAFDGAADDALAALNAIGMTFPEADTSKVMTRGGSRGATVVLLMGIRDTRVQRVVSVAGPTDLISATKDHQNDPTYRFQFLDKLINGTESMAQTRMKLIASSPLYFCSQLPMTQLHLGEKDEIVPPLQGQLLFDSMKAAGKQDNLQLFLYPNRTHDNIASGNVEMEQQINTFFETFYK